MGSEPKLRLALAQINPTVGAVGENAALIAAWLERASDEGADLVLFPELSLPGYPAEDLYLKRHFLQANAAALDELAAQVSGIAALVGFAEPRVASGDAHPFDAPAPRAAHNALALLRDGRVDAVYRKQRLPNYAVFDEQRYFEPGAEPVVVEVAGAQVGLTICEDVWEPGPPASVEAERGAELIVCPSGSPYYRGKRADREEMFARRARDYGTAFAFCNLVGGQDELVFDGASFVLDANGELVARAGQFEEELLLVDLGGDGGPVAEPLSDLEEVYGALVLGLRDYVSKNGFDHVLVAVSGGIDSALVALVAADALGGDRVTGVVMPSPHSSRDTQADARAIIRNIGADLVEIPIEPAMGAYDLALDGSIEGGATGLAAENLQARIRGNLMMALSNAHGWLVLTTGNKSEMSVGLRDALRRHGRRLRRDQGRAEDAGLRARAPSQRCLPHPARARVGARARAVGRAAARPARLGLAAPVRGAGRDPCRLRRGRPLARRDRRRRGRPGRRRRDPADGRPRGVQAPPGAAGDQDHRQGVRPGPAPADHQPVRRLVASRAGPGRTAIVIRTIAQSRSESSVISTSQIQVVRPAWRRRAVAWTLPSVIGRRKVAEFDWPTGTLPSDRTAWPWRSR